MLQKPGMYKATATAHVTVLGDFGESIFTIHNSVLQNVLASHDLTNLLEDGQDMEEYFLECGSLKVDIQNDNVIAMVKVPEEILSTIFRAVVLRSVHYLMFNS